ncbi:bifunctional adenosylcobinamide kinase/adenosylcobinamide-phosphate guanylyltransferase [Variovorax dokdonensis]|uniref:Bifunctional adenosylcobalamin biosynthesis protein n=1 Tax=Variovorax dokdonensis TaxID=344883 RepID=A0ABT7N8J9_9BURK|nr:bifunctional adenosylcobinamide kinase/adenosylcobinamide-phosphate guanylyltransferase [Variovorax dokdonensis]MDM0044241.1 bifunctional adenosylcobinamide kinase/adenosylcobinamide-phosphate guanylyltransferase [Variovorax dokdonensis]
MQRSDLAAPARRELILGGQKSGKSRRGESLAAQWLAQSSAHRAVLLATALGGDEEMRERIARHRLDRAARVPRLETVEAPRELAEALRAHQAPHTLVLIDCLTVWLTQLLMPAGPDAGAEPDIADDADAQINALLLALGEARGPVVLVGNEIGLGVIPLGRDTRRFVDALGLLNQRVAASCERVTLMVAGLPLVIKEPAP